MMTAEEAGVKMPQFHEEVSAEGRLTEVTESDIPAMMTSFAAEKGSVMSLPTEPVADKGSMVCLSISLSISLSLSVSLSL
jgi:hypothetical protein